MSHTDNIANIFAYIGGIAGISSIAVNILKMRMEKRKILVDGGIGVSPNGEKALIINATNFGRRPIFLIGIAFQDHKHIFEKYLPVGKKLRGQWFLYPDRPAVVGEGNFKTFEIKDFKHLLSGEYKYVFVYDSLDKCWRLKKRRLKMIIKQAD